MADNRTDPAFEAWLRRQVELGHDREWMRRNMPEVERAYLANPMGDLAQPQRLRPEPVGDRYAGL